MAVLQVPSIHSNGTSRESLTYALHNAYIALDTARRALIETCPHGRDYYIRDNGEVCGATYQLAREQYFSRMKRLTDIQAELLMIYSGIQGNFTEVETPE